MPDALNQRLRLIRFRRQREHTRFRVELRIIPRWLLGTCLVLYLLAMVIGLGVNLHNLQTGEPVFPGDESLRNQPLLSCLGLAGVITVGSLFVAIWILMLGYVYRDAKRRGMHPGLWTLLVLILSPAYLFVGLVIFLLIREPLPYDCPRCARRVSARFNFCPNCKYNLHPACPQCQQEVSDSDKFCPYCASELLPSSPSTADSPPEGAPIP